MILAGRVRNRVRGVRARVRGRGGVQAPKYGEIGGRFHYLSGLAGRVRDRVRGVRGRVKGWGGVQAPKYSEISDRFHYLFGAKGAEEKKNPFSDQLFPNSHYNYSAGGQVPKLWCVRSQRFTISRSPPVHQR